MFITISLSILILIAVFMYLVLLGASKCKTKEEIEIEDREQMEALTKWRQEHYDRQNKKKRNIFSRFRKNIWK